MHNIHVANLFFFPPIRCAPSCARLVGFFAALLCRLFHYAHGLCRYFFLSPKKNKEFGKPHVFVFAPQNFLFFLTDR